MVSFATIVVKYTPEKKGMLLTALLRKLQVVKKQNCPRGCIHEIFFFPVSEISFSRVTRLACPLIRAHRIFCTGNIRVRQDRGQSGSYAFSFTPFREDIGRHTGLFISAVHALIDLDWSKLERVEIIMLIH